jgi:hypothetical protein
LDCTGGSHALGAALRIITPRVSAAGAAPRIRARIVITVADRCSSKLPSGLCAENAAPLMSTLPSESITTSEDRASAVRAAATDVAAPTASAAHARS